MMEKSVNRAQCTVTTQVVVNSLRRRRCAI